MPCPACNGWNLPLLRRQHVTATGVAVAMSFQDWIIYTLHVVHHQGPALWGGEIDAVSALLQHTPDGALMAGPNPPLFPQNA